MCRKKELSGDFRIAAAEKFRVIPLGLDLDNFTIDLDEKRNKFRTEFGLDDDTVAIGIIGRLVPVKNHSLFLTALKYVLNNSSVKVKAFIIGDGESRASIEKLATTLDIKISQHTDKEYPNPLILTSWRTDIDTICAGLDIIALTSLNEGTPCKFDRSTRLQENRSYQQELEV
jgi:glycosyltransferase involved in cell wall biosynthesis